jgi:hypothetical protein
MTYTYEKKLSYEQRQEIIEKHFEKKISQTQLAKEYGVSREMIWRYCHKNGDSPLKRDYLLDDKQIIDLYTIKKMSVLQISSLLKLSTKPVTRRLRLAGVIKKVSSRNIWTKDIPHYHLKMKIWVAKVIERDGMICKWCGVENSYDNRLEANHIIPVRDMETPELLFDISNGITLCRKCHMKIHYHENEFVDFFRNLI